MCDSLESKNDIQYNYGKDRVLLLYGNDIIEISIDVKESLANIGITYFIARSLTLHKDVCTINGNFDIRDILRVDIIRENIIKYFKENYPYYKPYKPIVIFKKSFMEEMNKLKIL